MLKITIISEQPGGIFIEYLQGRKGIEIVRLKPSEINQLDKEDESLRILVINLKKLAPSIKEDFPLARVMAVDGGGTEKFHSYIKVIHVDKNHDYHIFDSWKKFEEIIFSSGHRKKNKFLYAKTGIGPDRDACEFYKVHSDLVDIYPRIIPHGKELMDFIDAMTFLSERYLVWMKDWVKSVSYLDFKIEFPFNDSKIAKTVELPLTENELRGLPIFKIEDRINFWDENNNLVISGFVRQINKTKMQVSLDRLMRRKDLKTITRFRPAPDFLTKKLDYWQSYLSEFEDLRMKATYERSIRGYAKSPIDFLADCANMFDCSPSNNLQNTLFGFSKSSRNILRDDSQMTALINATSSRFIKLVSGPAATGKTFFGACAIEKFIKERKIVIMVSHSNLGVDQMLCETAKHIDPKYIFRIGNNPEVMTKQAKTLHKTSRHERGFFGENEGLTDPTMAEFRYIKELIQQDAGLVFGCTLDSYHLLAKILKKLKKKPEIGIIDEASKGYFFELLPIIFAVEEKICFIGDDQQIGNIAPPKELVTFLENSLEDNDLPYDHPINQLKLPKSFVYYFNYGFFNSLIELGYFPVDLLKINRRSLKNISDMVSEVFYNGEVICGLFNPKDTGIVILYDTKNIEKAFDKSDGTSSYNTTEISWSTKKLMHSAVHEVKKGGSINNLVYLTPYSAQVRRVKGKLRKNLIFSTELKKQVNPENINEVLNGLVRTVDGIQGGQSEIVFASLVKSNDENDIGFNNDHRRIRVAFSRAMRLMVIICNSETFINCDFPEISEIFIKMISYIKRRGKYIVLENLK